MRVLSIGTDRKLFDKGSATRLRHEVYAEKLGQLDCIVFAIEELKMERHVSDTLSITPTNSISRITYGIDAAFIAWRLPRPDVLTAQDPFFVGLIGWMVSRMLGTPLHVQIHTDISAFSWMRQRLAYFVLRRATGIRVVLERTKEEIEARGITTPVEVLPIFVDTTRFVRLPRTKHPRWKIALLYVGRLEPEKNPALAIAALAAAKKAGHDAGLTIVGVGSLEAVLADQVRTLGLERNVEFKGYQKDTTPFLSSADVLLVPSLYEGYGMVIVEALAAGVPVLSTDVGIAREAGAIVVRRRDFTRALLSWIANGPRQGTLALSMPNSFDVYADIYVADLRARVAE